MNKYIFLLLTFAWGVFAVERPEWYPENAAEIGAKCKEEYSITPEHMAELQKMRFTDTPTMRSLVFCSATRKNVYRPGVGFEPERFAAALKYEAKLDCKMESMRDCTEKHKDLKPENYMLFSTVKCIFDNAADYCNEVEI